MTYLCLYPQFYFPLPFNGIDWWWHEIIKFGEAEYQIECMKPDILFLFIYHVSVHKLLFQRDVVRLVWYNLLFWKWYVYFVWFSHVAHAAVFISKVTFISRDIWVAWFYFSSVIIVINVSHWAVISLLTFYCFLLCHMNKNS